MRIDPKLARTLLPRVDPGRVRSGRAVGLRDGAVLTLVAAGLTTLEIAALRATAVTMANRQAVVEIHRQGICWHILLHDELGGWLLAWLTEARIWGLPEPVFQGCRGPLTAMGIWKILERYRNPQEGRSRRQALNRSSGAMKARTFRRETLHGHAAADVVPVAGWAGAEGVFKLADFIG